MTRAALLPLLAHPEALPATAVQDLEQLALAFPYCQTAHLLLAKAAHDQGSMLAGQRLRRAATYAADRQLLRQLLEQPARPPEGVLATAATADSEADTALHATNASSTPTPEEASLEVAASEPSPVAAKSPSPSEELLTQNEQPSPLTLVETPGVERHPAEVPAVAAGPDPVAPQLSNEVQPVVAETLAGPVIELEAAISAASEPETVAVLTDASPTEVAAAAPAPGEPVVPVALAQEPDAAPLPIQPSVEGGTARFEFGLGPALEKEFTSYQLPDFIEEESAVEGKPVPAPAERDVFRGASDLAYALGGGSRLGYALQAAELTNVATTTIIEVGAVGMSPGSSLPPAGTFFEPDALLLEHLARQSPLSFPAPSSLDLIDSFLRRTPQRRRGIASLMAVAEQPDLSVRSTQAEPDLASESLARILAGQGKTDRAIAVYERLMGRQPEKSSYFAAQIDLLRNPPTPSS